MAARGQTTAYRRLTGDQLGVDGAVEEIFVECGSCGARHKAALDADESIRLALARIVCVFCGRVGTHRRARPEVA